jgi:hypothetical protein
MLLDRHAAADMKG